MVCCLQLFKGQRLHKVVLPLPEAPITDHTLEQLLAWGWRRAASPDVEDEEHLLAGLEEEEGEVAPPHTTGPAGDVRRAMMSNAFGPSTASAFLDQYGSLSRGWQVTDGGARLQLSAPNAGPSLREMASWSDGRPDNWREVRAAPRGSGGREGRRTSPLVVATLRSYSALGESLSHTNSSYPGLKCSVSFPTTTV